MHHLFTLKTLIPLLSLCITKIYADLASCNPITDKPEDLLAAGYQWNHLTTLNKRNIADEIGPIDTFIGGKSDDNNQVISFLLTIARKSSNPDPEDLVVYMNGGDIFNSQTLSTKSTAYKVKIDLFHNSVDGFNQNFLLLSRESCQTLANFTDYRADQVKAIPLHQLVKI